MYTLGIETSCDETSCAILKNHRILSNVTVSSLRQHKKYGGIVPEIATRAHLKNINAVFTTALRQAGISLRSIGLIAATQKPGLIGALVVGLNFAKGLSLALEKPLIGVNHLHAHLFAPFLDYKRKLRFPFLGVVISGGHTDLYRVDDFNSIKLIGQTSDDACGEVLDKVSVSYGLGYPGGPRIDKIFEPRYQRAFVFRCGRKGFDLSFSGIKTALIYKKDQLEKAHLFDAQAKKRLLSSLQYSIFETVIATIIDAAHSQRLTTVVCGGGVAANSYLRKRLREKTCKDLRFFLTPRHLAGDNAAIVAGLGFYLYNKHGLQSPLHIQAKAG